MADLIEDAWEIAAAVVAALTGAGAVWSYTAAKAKAGKSSPADAAQADAKLVESAAHFAQALGESWQKHTDELRNEIRELNATIDEQGREISALKAGFAECEAHRIECDQAVAELRLQATLRDALAPPPPFLPGLDRSGS